MIAFCCFLCGGEDCSDMAVFGRCKELFLRQFLRLLLRLVRPVHGPGDSVDPFGNFAILRFNHLLPPFNNPEMRRALLPGTRDLG